MSNPIRLSIGSAIKNETNKQAALAELAEITDPSDVNDALVELDKGEPGILGRYKQGYQDYLDNVLDGDYFQWPLTYLSGRASRKHGKESEGKWIASVYGVGKNHQEFLVEDEDGNLRRWIPDVFIDEVVGEVKNTKVQSLDEQLRAFYTIAKQKDPISQSPRDAYLRNGMRKISQKRSFELIVRSEVHPDGETEISQPLEDALDEIHYEITE